MTRPNPILNFPDATLSGIMKRLIQTSGRLTAINHIPLLRVTAGQNVPAGATVAIEGTQTVLNSHDALANHMRLVIRGKTAAAGPITCNVIDVTNSNKVLCSVTVTTTLAMQIGTWTRIVMWNVDHTLQLQVVGDSANAQTLYSVEIQSRTITAP